MYGLEYYDGLGQFEAAGTGHYDGVSAALFSPTQAPTVSVAPSLPFTQVHGVGLY